jgi:hypothetical protein
MTRPATVDPTLEELQRRAALGDESVTPDDLSHARSADELAELHRGAQARRARADRANATRQTAHTTADEAAARWYTKTAELLALFDGAVAALVDLAEASATHTADVERVIHKLDTAQREAGPIPGVTLERHNAAMAVHAVRIGGYRTTPVEAMALVAEAALRALQSAGLGNGSDLANSLRAAIGNWPSERLRADVDAP